MSIPTVPIPPKSPPLPTSPPSRITVVETIYHISPGDEPVAIQSSYNRVLSTDEQPCIRRGKTGKEWARIDSGWVDEPSVVLLQNVDPRANTVTETVSDRTIEVGIVIGSSVYVVATILPGESMRFSPSIASAFRIRSVISVRYIAAFFPG